MRADGQDRMVARKYDTWEEFFADADLMCANAMAYNEDGSEVFQDASQIKVSTGAVRRAVRGAIRAGMS
jgi:hypothetical protein